MPDILIRGMEMPTKGYKTIILHSNGRVYEPTSEELIVNKIADATELPPHGDLIDRDALLNRINAYVCGSQDSEFIKNEIIKAMPVIVPAERREGDA